MKRALTAAVLFALLAILPAAHAADVSGTWKGAFDYDGNSMPLTLHLTVAAGVVTGKVEGGQTAPADIHDGKLDGDTVTFWINSDYQGQTYKLVYTGKVSAAGNEIAFTFGTEDQSWSAQLTVTKSAEAAPAPAPAGAAADATGTWKGALSVHDTSMPVAFHLTGASGTVTGTVEGLGTTPADIHDGKLEGDTVSFWVNTDYQGQTFKLMCKGKIAAGQIMFTIGTEDQSWSTQVTAAKGA